MWVYLLTLYNTPLFKQFVGDKQLVTITDSEQYLTNNLISMYQQPFMGLLKVSLKNDNTAIGICGLIKRDSLQDIDLGYGYLPEYLCQGYGTEAATACLTLAHEQLSLKRIVAITQSDNQACIKLLTKLGFSFEHNNSQIDELTTLDQYGLAL
ncbi:GNAT family N-acetyltransferase [Shewanella marina]|uniref:GNAT family N-acetyltransferase n=1 Tax=Shewanella marina TaxID=487319 RepID=UPI000688C6CC|nr:GNAT family protein [Shewanella marina]